MLAETKSHTTTSFYRYFTIVDPQTTRGTLWAVLTQLKVFDRIYLAREGISAQTSVPEGGVEALRGFLYGFGPTLAGLRFDITLEGDGKPSQVLRLKVRDRIVADSIDDPSFNAFNVGDYLKAADVDVMLNDPDAVFIDMRNHYEYKVGHFENALEIPMDTFHDQLPETVEMMQDHKDKKIVMYCTGGVRCEKASTWMEHNGFSKVWYIEDGIIKCVRRAREQGLPVRFISRSFVFDERMGERISDDVITHCHQCSALCDARTNCLNDDCHLLFIQCPSCAKKFASRCSEVCIEEHKLPEEEQRKLRAECKNGNKIFNKSCDQLNTKLGIPKPELSEKP